MPSRSSDQIRADFIEFWLEMGSHLQLSSSLIPYNDPTVLLTTAGMQQFVPYFLGKERPPHTRYVSVQKCFRTSDIDEVGDRSHLTFFEMLGNFSIGDYFKKEVIPWALEFSTKQLGLDQERLWITIHETDDEANEIWLKAGIPQERIKRFGDEHNWWGPPGTSGPCGPNSELYYEQGPGFGCGFPEDPPDCDCGRLEFWNLVFMQYNQDENGVRTLLPKKNVDTGMGLERAAVVANGLQSIYDTDLFQPIIAAAESIAGVTYGGGDSDVDYALRVLADHARGMTFLVQAAASTSCAASCAEPSTTANGSTSIGRSWASWSTRWSSGWVRPIRTWSPMPRASRVSSPAKKSSSAARSRRAQRSSSA